MRNFHQTIVAIFRTGLICTALLLSLVRPALAQTGSIRFETLSVEDGLSQSTVRAVMQDSRGYMWFGTDDGLNRYDGYSFTIFKHDPETDSSISDSTIQAIYQDTHGDLWFGTANGLDRLVPGKETFAHYISDPTNPASLSGSEITSIVEDRQGNLWIGTSDYGLNLLNRDNGTFTHFLTSPEQSNSLISNQITALAADQRGGLWIGTSEGLDYFDPQTKSYLHYRHNPRDPESISSNQVTTLFQDRFGILWIGTEDGGLNRYNPATRLFTRYLPDSRNQDSISSQIIRAIYEDQNGRLWIGGRNGIDLFNRETNRFQHYHRVPGAPYSLSNDYVLSIFADRTGVLWVGTYGGGVNKYVQANERFTLFQNQSSVALNLSNDIVNSIYEDHAGVVWVGTLDGGLDRLDPETGALTSLQHNQADLSSLGNNDVRAIIEDRTNTLWVGTYGGGLNRYDQRTGRFSRYIHNTTNRNSIADSQVTALLEDKAGNLWVGTRGGGLDRFDRSTNIFTHFTYSAGNPHSLSNNTVQTMFEDQDGNLWVGTLDGINILDPITQQFTRYQNDPNNSASLSNDRVMTFYEAPDGTMWIGTLLGGLNRFDRRSKTFKHYTQDNGLPNNTIFGILADSAGYLWMSTNWGLSRFDPRTETFRNYDRRDGLQSNEFSPGAYFQNNQGWMYFGGVQGFNIFDPSRVQDNPVAPPVVITAFKKFNQNQPFDPESELPIKLSYQDNFISFEFAALDYTAPEKNQYAYKLEGFDKNWIEAGTRRYASYTNLRGGSYTFRVIGSNPDGVWNETGAKLIIEVVPPIWERWWFIGTAVLILLGSVFGGYRLRIVRIQAQNRSLEQQVHERTQEIERRSEVAEGLREIMALLNSNRTLKESLDAIILQITRLMETRAVVIFRCGEDCFPLVLASNLIDIEAAPMGKGIPPLPNWITAPVLEGQRLNIFSLEAYAKTHPEVEGGVFHRFHTLLGVPFVVNDKVDGGLVLLYNYDRALGEEDVQIAANFADHAALAIANAELRNQAEEIAVSAERSRLARDLHDAVTQTLFATSLIAEVLPRLWERNPEAGKQKIGEIRELTRGALAEMRTLLMELRPTALEDVPLPDLLQQLSEAFTGRARIPVIREVYNTIELPSQVKIGFYRITQEALNNIQKHSRATQASLKLSEENGQVELCVADNGIGFEPGKFSPDHFGLGIMEERAQNINAQFTIESQSGAGTRIIVLWERTPEHERL
jgi:ligand-binding sensor domain-containing protein/signal transduction histidine kinase